MTTPDPAQVMAAVLLSRAYEVQREQLRAAARESLARRDARLTRCPVCGGWVYLPGVCHTCTPDPR